MNSDAPFRLGSWFIDPSSREISRAHEPPVRISVKAMGVLQVLAANPGRVVSRHALLDSVWPGVSVCEEVLTHAVSELRSRLDDRPGKSRSIETVYKAGYRLLIEPEVEARAPRPATRSTPSPFNPDAYLTYLDGRDHFERGGKTPVRQSTTLYRRAIELDPTWAPAHAELACALSFLYLYYDPSTRNLDEAIDAADLGIRLDPSSAASHAALGLAMSIAGDHQRATQSFGGAVRIDPENFQAHYLYGRVAFVARNYALSAALFERAATIRPRDFHSLILAGKSRSSMGDTARALRCYSLALKRLEAHLTLHPDDPRAVCDKAICLAELSDRLSLMNWILEIEGLEDPMGYYVACSLARTGEVNAALHWLESAVDTGWSHGPWLTADGDLDSLRNEPRFRSMARMLNAG